MNLSFQIPQMQLDGLLGQGHRLISFSPSQDYRRVIQEIARTTETYKSCWLTTNTKGTRKERVETNKINLAKIFIKKG